MFTICDWIGSHFDMSNFNVLVAVTGSVASIKLPLLIQKLKDNSRELNSATLRVVATDSSLHFFDKSELAPDVTLYTDKDEWSTWQKMGDSVLHIELRRWADILVIAPLDANTMAKLAVGICDNLLTCTVRAWDNRKPLLCCPGMNTLMWEHPITTEHISKLQSFGYTVIYPISKTLACGDTGVGAMAEVETIAKAVWDHLLLPKKM